MTEQLEKSHFRTKDYNVSVTRFIALLFIITCHMMQYKNFVLAWWFNVGVQVFFCISGYLYGQRNQTDVISFYSKRIRRILAPYYVTFIFAALLEVVFVMESFSIPKFAAGLFCRTTIAGGEHLWFVSYIILCYVLTPLLNIYRDRYVKNVSSLCIFNIGAVVIVFIFFGLFDKFFNPAWISCYVIGYTLGVNHKDGYISEKVLLILFAVVALIGNAIQIYIDYIADKSFSGYIGTLYGYFCNYNHVWLGVFLFLTMRSVFSGIKYGKHLNMFLDIADSYSYEIYLVHQFFILGPFSLMTLTSVLPLNIVVILIGVAILAWILKKIETLIMKNFM